MERSFECDERGKYLSEGNNLKQRKTTQSGESNDSTMQEVLRSIKEHSGAKDTKCQQRCECFSEAGYLWRQKRIHRGDEPFECDQRQHERMHSSENQLKYEQTDNSYSISELLSDIKKIKQEDLLLRE